MKDRGSVFYFMKAGAMSASILPSILNYTYLYQFIEIHRIYVMYTDFGESDKVLFNFMTYLIMVIRGKCIPLIKCYYDRKKDSENETILLTGFSFICSVVGTIGVLRVSKLFTFINLVSNVCQKAHYTRSKGFETKIVSTGKN